MGIVGGEGVLSRGGGGEGVSRGGIGSDEKSVFEGAGLVNILSFGERVIWGIASVMLLFRRTFGCGRFVSR